MDLASARHVKHELRGMFDEAVRARGDFQNGRRVPRVAFGVAPDAERDSYRIAVRARTPEDLPEDIADEIREEAAGEIDLRFTGPVEVRPAGPGQPTPHLAIGSSVGHYRCSAGTLGFFARRTSDGAIGIVSNNHVLAVEDQGMENDDILHPAPADRGRRPRDVVARLAGRYPRLRRSEATVDCAFAPLLEGVSFDPRLRVKGRRTSATAGTPENHREVFKIGRTTGLTYGRITAFEFEPFDVDYTFGSVRFVNQIEIESAGDETFAEPGDSGSLVFSKGYRNPVGLVFAQSACGGTFASGLTYANPIELVLAELGVAFMT